MDVVINGKDAAAKAAKLSQGGGGPTSGSFVKGLAKLTKETAAASGGALSASSPPPSSATTDAAAAAAADGGAIQASKPLDDAQRQADLAEIRKEKDGGVLDEEWYKSRIKDIIGEGDGSASYTSKPGRRNDTEPLVNASNASAATNASRLARAKAVLLGVKPRCATKGPCECLPATCTCCWHGNFSCCHPPKEAVLEQEAAAEAACRAKAPEPGHLAGPERTENRSDDCIRQARASSNYFYKHTADNHLGYEAIRTYDEEDECCRDNPMGPSMDPDDPSAPPKDFAKPPDVPFEPVMGSEGGGYNDGPRDGNAEAAHVAPYHPPGQGDAGEAANEPHPVDDYHDVLNGGALHYAGDQAPADSYKKPKALGGSFAPQHIASTGELAPHPPAGGSLAKGAATDKEIEALSPSIGNVEAAKVLHAPTDFSMKHYLPRPLDNKNYFDAWGAKRDSFHMMDERASADGGQVQARLRPVRGPENTGGRLTAAELIARHEAKPP